jgi:hypothetical protein
MNAGEALTWREALDKHFAAMVDELALRIDSDLETARGETAAQERSAAALQLAEAKEKAASEAEASRAESIRELTEVREAAALELVRAKEQATRSATVATVESLNQILRRMRQAVSQGEVLSLLLEGAAPYSSCAVVLQVENHQARSFGVRGLAGGPFAFPLDAAPAILGLCETREPLVALASPGELTPELAEALASVDPGGKAYLFALTARLEVIAVLVAAGVSVAAGLELLAEVAGTKLESLESPALETPLQPLPGSDLVQIVPTAVPESSPVSEKTAWKDLSAEDQRIHLQAQRVARVKVAEMRLYHAEALRRGVFDGNIYAALKAEIDSAREEFLKSFLAKSPTMVDYLHLEILRSLAHEDDRLLGHEYPGPMV